MKLLEQRLQRAVAEGESFVTITLPGCEPDLVANVVATAEELHWHVKAVWGGEANITYVLFRYRAV